MRHARLVLNPAHLGPALPTMVNRLLCQLHALDVVVEVLATRPGIPVAPQVASEAERYDFFLVWGGDGTVADVATGLLGTGTPLGVLPGGTFNNVAHALGLPPDPLAAAGLLAAAPARAMDVGFANGRLFLEVAGVGLDAAVMPFGERLKKHQLAALLPALVRLARVRAADMTLDLDDARGVRVRTPLVVLANGPFYGAGFTVAPDARWDDGRLTVRVFEGATVPEIVWTFAHIAQHRRPCAVGGLTFRARRVRVAAAVPLGVHADGRPAGKTPAVFEAQAGALLILVPAPDPAGESLARRPAGLAGAPR